MRTLRAMETTWDKTRPIVFAVGLHVFLLALICLGFVQAPAQQISSAQSSIIEASLVSVPPSESNPPVSMPRQSLLQVARHVPHGILNQAEERHTTKTEQAVAQPEPQHSDEQRSHAPIEPPTQQQRDSDSGDQPSLAQQQPDLEASLEEMRKQRAEQERQRQLTAQSDEDQQTQQAQAGVPNDVSDAFPAPARMFPGNGTFDQQFFDSFFAATQFTLDSGRLLNASGQLTRCGTGYPHLLNDDLISTDWIECVLDAAMSDPTSDAMNPIESLKPPVQ